MIPTFVRDMNGNVVNAADVDLPANRDFRNAWLHSGPALVEDLEASRAIFLDNVREHRKDVMTKLDAEFSMADEKGNPANKKTAGDKRQVLRDLPTRAAITNAGSIAALKAAWPIELGDSPYV